MGTPWTPDALLELTREYQPACVLMAAAELDIFAILADRPLTADEAAQKVQGDGRAVTILLDALAALRLLTKTGDCYSPAAGTVDALTDRGAGSVLAMVRHQASCLRRWSDLAAVVKSGQPGPRRPGIRGADADYAAFVEAMDNIARTTAAPLVAQLPRLNFRHLLDVGGASGSYTVAFLNAYPGARATLFDLPVVIPQARQRLEAAGLLDRVTLVPGDFYTDILPGGADLAWVSAIVHQNSRQQNRELFAKVHAALAPGGIMLIRDILMDETRTAPAAGALFAVNMLVATQAGGTFTVQELSDDLTATGFANPRVLRPDQTMSAVLAADRP